MDKKLPDIPSTWERHHRSTIFKDRETDPLGLDVVCVPGYPLAYNKMLHYFQEKVLDKLVKNIHASGGKIVGEQVLDVGCGTGRWSSYFQKKGACVTAIDISQPRLDDNKKRYPSINFKKMYVDELSFKDNSFKIINVSWVLQHNPYNVQENAAKEMLRILNEGGFICFMEGCHENKFPVPQHSFPRTSEEWKMLFEVNGGEVVYSTKILETFLPDVYVKYRNKARVWGRSLLGMERGEERQSTEERTYDVLENKNQKREKYAVLKFLFNAGDQIMLRILSYLSYPVEFLNYYLFSYYKEGTLVLLVRKK